MVEYVLLDHFYFTRECNKKGVLFDFRNLLKFILLTLFRKFYHFKFIVVQINKKNLENRNA